MAVGATAKTAEAEIGTITRDVKPGERKLRDVDRMGGFAKGLSVIEAFGEGRNRLTIAEVARLSGLDRASARRCLLTLVERRYATNDDRYFELTPRILKLGHSYLAASLPRLIRPALDGLADQLRESCSAAVLDGTEVVYIARSSHHRIMGAGLHPGSRLPAYCTSLGRVLLAALPRAQAKELIDASDRQSFTYRGEDEGAGRGQIVPNVLLFSPEMDIVINTQFTRQGPQARI